MKRKGFFCVAAVLLLTGTVRAALTVYEYVPGQKVTLDTLTGNYWYWNLEDFVNMTYAEQMADIAGLGTYGNIAGGWHMADEDEMDSLFSHSAEDIGTSFAASDAEALQPWNWHGRADIPSVTDSHLAPHVYMNLLTSVYWYSTPVLSVLDSLSSDVGAWVTTAAPVVPVPGSLILATFGLLTVGVKLRRRKR